VVHVRTETDRAHSCGERERLVGRVPVPEGPDFGAAPGYLSSGRSRPE
jgi:hypothetical protein